MMMTSPEPAASSLLPPAASPELVASIQHALALKDLLEQEFEALRAQDLDAFEAMQPRKLDIFRRWLDSRNIDYQARDRMIDFGVA